MCFMKKKSDLHISCWNINGYKSKGYNKYEDDKFINEIKGKDIICLMETHCAPKDSLYLQGYKSVNLSRKSSKKCKKISGGISVFVKSDLKDGIKFLEHKTDDYIWLQLISSFFGTSKDIFLCFIYNPPDNSSYTKTLEEDIFDLVEKDVEKFSKQGDIILAGDLNSRTGNEQLDLIEDDVHNDFSDIFDACHPDINIPIRFSSDNIVSTRGKILNDLCIQTGLRILNGRTTGDLTGQLTCYTPNVCSVVDYFMVSKHLFTCEPFFKVHNFIGELSDHSQISMMLKIKGHTKVENSYTKQLPNKYIWDENSNESFQCALSSKEIKEKINNFEKTEFSKNVDNMVETVNEIRYQAANISLKQKKGKLKNFKQNNKRKPKWIDLIPLSKLKKNVEEKGRLLQKNPFDHNIRIQYFSLLKQYRKVRKKKIREHRQTLIEKLDEMKDENPKQYWDLLHELSNKGNENHLSEINAAEWFNYFKELNKNKSSDIYIINQLKMLEAEKIFTELDNVILKKEIEKAISSLKNKKSSGFDSILNEMIKSSQVYLLNCFQKIFNTIYSHGEFPKIWSKGFIVPIF